jgi:hypothetical protein
MSTDPAARLIGAWNPSGRAPAHRRLAVLLAAIDDADACRHDTLGARNRRLLLLHRTLVGGPLEALAACAVCGMDHEFIVPADAILEMPAPAADARVRIRSRGRSLSFRLPRMTDIEAASGAASVADVRHAVLERCRIEGDGQAISGAAAERLAREFEALDPAADIVVSLTCSGCGSGFAASVDLAGFIVRGIDRVVDSLYRDIDAIASAYGWDEPTILALPADRRRRYVEMIATRARPRPAIRPRTQ